MNEISVNVKQEPGKVTWNFEEIKTNLEAALAEYTSMVYPLSRQKPMLPP